MAEPEPKRNNEYQTRNVEYRRAKTSSFTIPYSMFDIQFYE